jgi:predicted GNAT family N-acyltransferase
MIQVYIATEKADLQAIFRIRFSVFVDEQMVFPDEEYDEYEQSATHFIAKVGGIAAGTSRWVQKHGGIKLERFAVLPHFRGVGVGRALASAMIADLKHKQLEHLPVFLHAQIQAVPFYEKLGFEAEPQIFEEAGILHHKMIYKW